MRCKATTSTPANGYTYPRCNLKVEANRGHAGHDTYSHRKKSFLYTYIRFIESLLAVLFLGFSAVTHARLIDAILLRLTIEKLSWVHSPESLRRVQHLTGTLPTHYSIFTRIHSCLVRGTKIRSPPLRMAPIVPTLMCSIDSDMATALGMIKISECCSRERISGPPRV